MDLGHWAEQPLLDHQPLEPFVGPAPDVLGDFEQDVVPLGGCQHVVGHRQGSRDGRFRDDMRATRRGNGRDQVVRVGWYHHTHDLRTHRVEQRNRMLESRDAVGLGSPLPAFLPRVAHANQAEMLA